MTPAAGLGVSSAVTCYIASQSMLSYSAVLQILLLTISSPSL